MGEISYNKHKTQKNEVSWASFSFLVLSAVSGWFSTVQCRGEAGEREECSLTGEPATGAISHSGCSNLPGL